MKYTAAKSEADMPPLYKAMAQTNKRTERNTLQQALNKAAQNLGIAVFAPTATPDLTKKVTQVLFYHEDLDNLEESMQPFVTRYHTPSDKYALQQTVAHYYLLRQGTGAQLSDILQFSKNTKIAFPDTILQAVYALKSCYILLQVLLGSTHTVVVKFNNLIWMLEAQSTALESKYRH